MTGISNCVSSVVDDTPFTDWNTHQQQTHARHDPEPALNGRLNDGVDATTP